MDDDHHYVVEEMICERIASPIAHLDTIEEQ